MLNRGTVTESKVMRGTTEIIKVMRGTTPIHAKVYVTFNENGGSAVTDKYCYYKQPYGTLPTPTRSGYAFGAWFTTTDFQIGTDVDENDTVNNSSDHTLNAFWQYSPQAPTINYVTKSATQISFTVTNNAPYEVTIYYEHSDNTPDANSVVVGANSTSGTLTISGLTPSTSYTIYAQADKEGAKSSVASMTQTTLANQTADPSFGTPFKTTTWRVYVYNNDASTITLYVDNNTNPPTTVRTTTLAPGASYLFITGSSVGGFYVYARGQASGEDMSNVVSVYI